MEEGSLGTDIETPEWLYNATTAIPGMSSVTLSRLEVDSDLFIYLGSEELSESIAIRVRPARASKCPRCWTFTRKDEDELCRRCADVVG